MGERANVIFVDEDDNTSPAVYLHWDGFRVKDWLEEAGPTLREGDVWYACARFIGFCHTKIEGSLSLGVMNTDIKELKDLESWTDGMDHGAFVVNVSTGVVTHHPSWCDKIPNFTIDLFHG